MPSSVDEQPPSRPRPQPARRRPPARARSAAPRRREAQPAESVDEPTARDRRSSKPPRSSRNLVVVLSVLTVVVVGLAALGLVLSSSTSKKQQQASSSTTVDTTPVPTTTFSDPQTGFTVAYPRSWKKVDVPVADYRLAVDGGSNVAFTIRVVPIQTPATAANLENFKAVTDGLVTSNPTVQILKQQAVSLNGMLGYYYFYTFTDGGVQAVHAHYFLFSGNKMNVIVFQSLPDDFAGLASTFDQIAESFRSDPNVPATAPPTAATAAPGSSTTTTAP